MAGTEMMLRITLTEAVELESKKFVINTLNTSTSSVDDVGNSSGVKMTTSKSLLSDSREFSSVRVLSSSPGLVSASIDHWIENGRPAWPVLRLESRVSELQGPILVGAVTTAETAGITLGGDNGTSFTQSSSNDSGFDSTESPTRIDASCPRKTIRVYESLHSHSGSVPRSWRVEDARTVEHNGWDDRSSVAR